MLQTLGGGSVLSFPIESWWRLPNSFIWITLSKPGNSLCENAPSSKPSRSWKHILRPTINAWKLYGFVRTCGIPWKYLDIFWIFMFLRHFATVCLLGPWTRETRGIQLMATSLLPAEQQLLWFMPDWVQTLPPSKNVLHRMAWQCGMAWHGLVSYCI